MHELGHNFNSGHTHESGSYTPVIDTCGTSCPSQLPLAKSSTIMSYCHLCSGNYANMDYTFGGKYIGAGHRSDINSYNNSALAGTVSTEPRRVNAKMWEHVSTRGTCTAPPPMGVSILFDVRCQSFYCVLFIHSLTQAFTPSFTSTAADYVDAHIRSVTL
jgi:hypothetical protein